MQSTSSSEKLNRFTTLPFLIELLETKKIALLSPNTWADHNDTDILLEYKSKRNIAGLLALCFTDQSETIHHWTAFSSSESGCCIEFKKKSLLEILAKDKRIKYRKVNYPTIPNGGKVDIEDIPFTKRYPYSCEQEYRIIIELDKDALVHHIQIPLDTISKITLGPRLPTSTFNAIKKVLESLIGEVRIEINHSTLFKNDDWIDGFKKRSTVGP